MKVEHSEPRQDPSTRFCCNNCSSPLVKEDDQIAIHQRFRGRLGDACLFREALNVKRTSAFTMEMTTGVHVVQDLFCAGCSQVVGWYYVEAPVASEVYKEGKYMLEKEQMRAQEYYG